jgi:hypothetical protein
MIEYDTKIEYNCILYNTCIIKHINARLSNDQTNETKDASAFCPA